MSVNRMLGMQEAAPTGAPASPTPESEFRHEVRGSQVSFRNRPNSHIQFVDNEELDYVEMTSGKNLRTVHHSGQVHVGRIVSYDPIRSATAQFIFLDKPLNISSPSGESSQSDGSGIEMKSEGEEESSEVCDDSTLEWESSSLQGDDPSDEVVCQLPSSPPTRDSQQLPELVGSGRTCCFWTTSGGLKSRLSLTDG